MKKCVSLILIIALVLGVVVLATSCDKTKGTPVYEGMTIVRYGGGAAYSAAENTVAQTDEEINNDFVNEDNGELEKPVDEVVTIVVNGSEKVEYFVMAGEVFTVQVHLSNPDNFEIQSFTLNGKKYANYMFKEGSDMELLLLDVTAPSTPGRFELTIDAIKYIDGSDIKDVRMDGEKTIKAGVMYTSMPIAVVRDVAVTQNVASMNVTVLDADGLVAANGVKMYLTQGDNIVAEKVLSPGVNYVTFENLVMDTTYGYGVVSTFDRFDGNGKVAHWLTEGSFSTGKAFRVTSVAAGKDYVDFTYARSIDTGVLTAIKLLDSQNRELAVLQGTDEPTFAGLLSGVTYKIKLEFTYELNGETRNGESVVSFNTVAKTVPVVSIEDITSTSSDMTFGLNIADKDNILSLDKIVLLEGDTEVEQFSVGAGYSASGLKSGTLYTIKVEYSYDLNDGNGVQKKTVSVDYPTLAASIAVEDIILLNTNVVKIGEELNMRIYFSNSSEIEMTDIYVNGIKVQVVGGDRTSSAIVKFVPDETGLIDFMVDKVEYLFFGTKVSQKIDSDVSVTYPIYGDLQDVSYENVSASPYEYTGLGICFTFDNGENYVVYKINDSDNFIKLANNSYFVPSDVVSTVEYGYENYGHTTQVIGYSAVKHTVKGYTTVSTPEEFMAMTDGYYVLTQDLDMRNVKFETAVNFTGILDGGGHTVRGLTNVIDTSKSQYFNIFSSYWGDKGSVYDTKFTELYVSVDNSRGNSPVAVSPLGDVILYNCAVSGDVLANNAIYTGLNIAQSSVSYTINKTINGVSSTDKADSKGDIEKTPAVTYEDGAIIFTSSSGGKVFVGYYENTMTEFDATPYFVVGSNAFAYCNSVTSIKIPADMEVPYLDFSSCAIVCAEYSTDHNINFDKSKLQTLVLSGSGEVSGFQYLEELREVTLKGSFTSIGNSAFYNCNNLTSIVIPAGVTSIGSNAFYNCDNLTSVYYLGDIAGWCGISGLYSLMSNRPALYINGAKVEGEFVIPEGVGTIPAYAFYGQTGITSLVIPDSVTSIGVHAFINCSSLASVTFGEGSQLATIGEYVFAGCSSLASITIPAGVTSIGDYAFSGCSSLASITIPAGVTSIGSNAFYNCDNLTSVYYLGDIAGWCGISGLDEIMSNGPALYINGAKVEGEVAIPDGVGTIPAYAFYGQTGITSLVIPDSVTSVGNNAFSGCNSIIYAEYNNDLGVSFDKSKLQTLVLSGSGEVSGFWGYTELQEVTLKGNFTSIGEYAFDNCSSLASITIPVGVTSIGNSAFYNCDNLTSVYYLGDITDWCGISGLDSLMSNGPALYLNGAKVEGEFVIPEGVETIPAYAFYGQTAITSITIPAGVTNIGGNAFYNCDNLTSVYYLGDIAGWCGISGLYSLMPNGPALYLNDAKVEGEVAIPEGVETIPAYAFYGQTGITSLVIPDSVTSVGNNAFSGCNSIIYAEYNNDLGVSFDKSKLQTLVLSGSGEVSGFGGCTELREVTLKGNFTSIGEYAFDNCNSLASIVIPAGVTSIGNYAFAGCSSLASITIPDSVTSIGVHAFINCSSLASVTFGEGSQLATIGSSAFAGCNSLASIVIPAGVTSIGSNAFYNCDNLTSVYYLGDITDWCRISGLDEIMSNRPALYINGAKVEGEFVIPEGVGTIPAYAFYGQTGITSLVIPDSVTSVGNNAFSGCNSIIYAEYSNDLGVSFDKSKLQTLVLSGSGEVSGFGGCTELREVILKGNFTSIGESAFSGCGPLASITIPAGVTSIGEDAFRDCSSLVSVTFGEGSQLATIGEYAFAGCNSLASITIPDSVTSIGVHAFINCSSLASVTFGEGSQLATIGGSAFSGCGPLASITIPAGVTSIGESAFRDCSSLASVTFGEGSQLATIGGSAFSGCSSLASITIPDSVTSIGGSAFYGCSSLASITIPAGVTSIGNSAFYNCDNLTSVYYLGDIAGWCGISGLDSLMKNSPALYINGAEVEGEVVIPDGVETIPNYAFYRQTGITSITIPAGVTSIGNRAFYNCKNLTSIVIPAGVTSIGDFAFSGCGSLASITIPDSVTSIGDVAFDNCDNLTSVYYLGDIAGWCGISGLDSLMSNGPALYINGAKVEGEVVIPEGVETIPAGAFCWQTGITSITIPAGVTSIGEDAFSGCSFLASITIPDSVTSIGGAAFFACGALESVYYGGTKEQWLKIDIISDIGNDNLTDADRYYYSETEPALNEDGSGYDGNYWRYADGVPTPWVYVSPTSENNDNI